MADRFAREFDGVDFSSSPPAAVIGVPGFPGVADFSVMTAIELVDFSFFPDPSEAAAIPEVAGR